MLTNKDTKYIQDLLKRYELGESTAAETHFIETYLNYLDEWNKEKDPFISLDAEAKQELEQEMRAKLQESMHHRDVIVRELKPRRRFGFGWRAAAAVLLLVCGAGTYWLFFNQSKHLAPVTILADQDIRYGIDRAVLKLANGQEVILDSVHGNIIQNKNFIVNNDSGTLHYEGSTAALEYHTLSTPRSAQYKLQLPDGTHVWMNAGSSITYPTLFTGGKREVAVKGEVYFEVAKNKTMPFHVTVNNALIEVTGTHFNINAYSDEPVQTTTLLEGGVKVTKNNSTLKLSPGEQSVINAAGNISKHKEINIDEIMSWKKGYFHFESADIETIMRQISRWYDVDISYEGPVSKEKFFMIIKRNMSLSAVLKALQANHMQFSIEGKKLTVKTVE